MLASCIFPQAAGKVCNCAFYRGPNSSDTQEIQFIEVGGSPILVEGGVCSSNKNVTVTIVNTCDCKLSLDLRCASLSVCVCLHPYLHVCMSV